MLGCDPGKRGRGKRQVGTGLRWTTYNLILVQKAKKFMRGSNRDGKTLPVSSYRVRKGYPKEGRRQPDLKPGA